MKQAQPFYRGFCEPHIRIEQHVLRSYGIHAGRGRSPAGSGAPLYNIDAQSKAMGRAANRAAADELLSRAGAAGGGPVPALVVRAMENLKLAMRLRLKRGPLDPAAAESIAAALDAAAQAVERS
jgi:hypothetical protein